MLLNCSLNLYILGFRIVAKMDQNEMLYFNNFSHIGPLNSQKVTLKIRNLVESLYIIAHKFGGAVVFC